MEKEIKKYNYNKFYKHTRLPNKVCSNIESFSNLFEDKNLSRAGTVKKMVKFFQIIKEDKKIIVFKHNKFKLMEKNEERKR